MRLFEIIDQLKQLRHVNTVIKRILYCIVNHVEANYLIRDGCTVSISSQFQIQQVKNIV
jgi:hypothetical protein